MKIHFMIVGELADAFSEAATSGKHEVLLATRGPKPLKVAIAAPKPPVVSHQDLVNLQNRLNLSDRGIK